MLPPGTTIRLMLLPVSSRSRAVWLYLLETSTPFDLEKVGELDAFARFAEFCPRAVASPILRDSTTFVYGGPTIMRYLGTKLQKYYPANLSERALVDSYLDWHIERLETASTTVLQFTCVPAVFFNTHFSDPTSETPTAGNNPISKKDSAVESFDLDKAGEAVKAYIETLKQMQNTFLSENEFLAGSSISIADIVAATEISYYPIIDVDLREFPKISEWFERVTSLLKYWDLVNEEFRTFVPNVLKKQDERRKQVLNMKKHGKDASGGNRSPDVFHQVLFRQPLSDVYKMMISQEDMAKRTGKSCTIGQKQGSAFSYYDGAITGETLYLMENHRLLQSWRLSDWPTGKFSTVKITFSKVTETSTEATLEQSDVPKAAMKKIDDIWNTQFWQPLDGVLLREVAYTLFFEYASPHMLYELLLDSNKMAKYTKTKCDISRGVLAEFTLLDSFIVGKNLALVTDAKLVQQWRCGDWPDGHYSIVTIKLSRVPGGTDLSFQQIQVPSERYRAVSDMWDRYFWKRIRREIKDNYESLNNN